MSQIVRFGRIGFPALDTVLAAHRQMNRLLDDMWGEPALWNGGWLPPLDVVETADEIRCTLEVPGMRGEDLEITVMDRLLMVQGEKKYEQQEGEDAGELRIYERRYGRFRRTLRLPATVDPETVHARCENGVLTITVKKKEEARPRKIVVE